MFSLPLFSLEAEILKSLVVAATPEGGTCWPAILKPITFLLGWRQAYPEGKQAGDLPSPCPKAGCAGKWVGKQIWFVTVTISTATKALSGVIFTYKAV